MIVASRYNQPEIVELLLEHNARTDLKDSFGQTALHHAAIFARLPVVQLLVGKSNVNARDNKGRTPLGYVVERDILVSDFDDYDYSYDNDDYDAVIKYLKQNGATM